MAAQTNKVSLKRSKFAVINGLICTQTKSVWPSGGKNIVPSLEGKPCTNHLYYDDFDVSEGSQPYGKVGYKLQWT